MEQSLVVDVDGFVLVLVNRFAHSGDPHLHGLKSIKHMSAQPRVQLHAANGPRVLELRAIVEHQGTSLSAADNHYVAYVQTDSGWHFVDGASATPVAEEDVLLAETYLALYQRVEPSLDNTLHRT